MNAKLVACGSATVVAIGIAITASAAMHSARYGDCTPAKTVVGKTISGRGYQYEEKYVACAGGFGSGSEEYFIILDIPGRDGREVFAMYSNIPPAVKWDSQDNLVISIPEVGEIKTSYLDADGIKIHYQAPHDLSREGFEEHLISYKDRVLKNITQGVSTFSTGSEAGDIKKLDEIVELERKSYSVFARWAQSHQVQYLKKGDN